MLLLFNLTNSIVIINNLLFFKFNDPRSDVGLKLFNTKVSVNLHKKLVPVS